MNDYDRIARRRGCTASHDRAHGDIAEFKTVMAAYEGWRFL
jgi:hypothetical protein